jgi:hypothetical protein
MFDRSRFSSRRPTRPATKRPRLEALEDRTVPSTIVVTTAADNGNDASPTKGSLRAAILQANNDTSPDVIKFNISGAGVVKTINVPAPLPSLQNTVTIDGTTQPGWGASGSGWREQPVVVLNNADTADPGINGLTLLADGNTVRGLDIEGFRADGIAIFSNKNTIIGNLIQNDSGADVDVADGASNNTIGGRTAQLRNVLSLAQVGVLLTGFGTQQNTVLGNYIGTSVNASGAVPNAAGVLIDGGATNNTIGDTTPAGRNVISGNTAKAAGLFGGGVVLDGFDTTGNVVEGNFIGTDPTGTRAVPNTEGVVVFASFNTIGGPGAAGNLISGNSNDGVLLSGASATGNLIQGNRIGTDRFGTTALANGSFGISIGGGASNNSVGVQTNPNGPFNNNVTGSPNVIAFNKQGGVGVFESFFSLSRTTGDLLSQNAIFSNGTPQSSTDPNIVETFGGNNGIPAPTAVTATFTPGPLGGTVVIQGSWSSSGNNPAPITIELFAGPGGPNGGGRFFLFSMQLDLGTLTSGTFTTPPLPLSAFHGQGFIVATATDSLNDTSPFSTPTRLGVPIGVIGGGFGGNGSPSAARLVATAATHGPTDKSAHPAPAPVMIGVPGPVHATSMPASAKGTASAASLADQNALDMLFVLLTQERKGHSPGSQPAL